MGLLVLAAVIATAPPAPHVEHPHAGLGVALGLGLETEPGRPYGWLLRLDYAALLVLPPPHRVGAIFGLTAGYEYWRGAPDWGFDVPVGFVIGIRAFAVRATVGLGVDALLVDHVANATGFGLYAPLASASAGVDVAGWQVMLDARVTRRWQFGADDRTQWTAAIMVGKTLESKD